ncbi:outer dense fiber protein 2 isoform X3 [Enoplosus armatus]|uniref:outer dense fiber protein 2 isoform X3 n=1 Tax=Enoplosus armatus TaxID=215367 RepID=UPI0039956A62
MRTRSSSPPIHVHVNDTTPVHVHVKSQGTSPGRTPQGKDRGNIRPTAKVKTRVPWIPPGKASVRDTSYKWEGPTHRLEIAPPLPEPEPERSQSALRLADLASEDEEGLHGRISQYERKIDSLLTEVGSLKNEVELRKKEQLLERQSERLSVSQRVITEQEEELAEVTKELEETERENARLRQSMEKMLEETDHSRLDRDSVPQDKDALLRKLTEAEADGTAAARQVSALRESVSKLCGASGSRLSGSESSALARQKELLLQKLETFEATNRTLRHLLREQHGSKVPCVESTRLSEQKDTLLKRLADTEAENARLVVRLQEKDREVTQLSRLLDAEKDNTKSTADLSKSLESTRAHLQGQLRSKEAEKNRLTVQIKNLERAANQQKAEMERLTERLARLRRQASEDREALKQATRAQKQRAERSEGTAGQLSVQLLDTERQVADALSAAETWQSRHAQEAKDKSKLEIELSLLNSHAAELTEQLRSAEDKSRVEREALLDHLHGLTAEITAAKLENQSLKAAASAVEERLALSQSELQQVKASTKQYESLLDSYKIQVGKTRAEADEYGAQLAQAERRAQAARGELEQEIEEVRGELLGRLAELEPLPEALRRCELQLREAQDRERGQERRSVELGATLTDLRMKVETQGSQMELLRQKNKALLEEKRQLQQRVESLERKLEEAGSQNGDLLAVIAKREDTIRGNQLRLEEKTRECSLLSRKLEESLDDAHQQMSETRERAATKEHSTQSKMLDLETQLSRTTSEINQLRRSKEEVERRYQSRLQDVKDRLEQSDSTNRSLQNYVQFLKASYANVFGDVALSSSLRAPSPI